MRRSLISRSLINWKVFPPLLIGWVFFSIATSASAYTLAVTPTTAAPGATATVSWTATAGTTATTDWIALARVGSADTSYLAWRYTGGATSGSLAFSLPTTPGDYEFRYFTKGSYTLVARSPVVTVTGTTPPATYTLAVTPTTAAPGATATVSWTATAGTTATTDWIALARVGSADTSYLAWRYTGGATSGSLAFSLPTTPGDYEFRYFTKGSYTLVARSPVVTVTR